uniref:Prolipoprotein diacylglyceryl transferase n=1 Tax=Acyrthosiphon pisum TaxID=7029 RepID=A0A8R2H9A5_ACYPI|eukprot:XP_016664747.1 PREDICTED: prolipoprotein diacylglyceryl transferase-like [Acyrthosiphon pisum]
MTNGYISFPQFDPVIFSIGPISLHWYGLMYLVGFVFAMWLAVRRANKPGSGWKKEEVENLLYAGFLGVFLGGRIGYVLFYNLPLFLDNPLYLFKVWDGAACAVAAGARAAFPYAAKSVTARGILSWAMYWSRTDSGCEWQLCAAALG